MQRVDSPTSYNSLENAVPVPSLYPENWKHWLNRTSNCNHYVFFFQITTIYLNLVKRSSDVVTLSDNIISLKTTF